MRTPLVKFILTGGLLASAALVQAELNLPKPSPKAEVAQTIGVTDIKVNYSAPAVKGRSIWGGLVPYGEIWRTGANACTVVSFSEEVKLASKSVPAGEYCLFTVPGKDSWEVVLNSDTKLWGGNEHDKKKDVARVKLTPQEVPFRERMTFSFSNFTDSKGELRLEWEKLGLAIPIEVDTKAHALRNIEDLKDGSWREYADAARYLLENDKAKEAMKYADLSIAKEETWFNNFVKGQILAKNGKYDKALEHAKKAEAMKEDTGFYSFFKPQIEQAITDWSSKQG